MKHSSYVLICDHDSNPKTHSRITSPWQEARQECGCLLVVGVACPNDISRASWPNRDETMWLRSTLIQFTIEDDIYVA